jgi:hypothetical protein
MRDVFRIIVQNEGLAGLYHGMGVNLIRTVPSSALTILTYVFNFFFFSGMAFFVLARLIDGLESHFVGRLGSSDG